MSETKRIYIAGPYTGGDVCINVKNAIRAAHEVREMGLTPFVPHLSHFWHMHHPRDYQDWLEMDFEWLSQCHALLRLPGKSPGAEKEIMHAEEQGIPVFYKLYDLFRWTKDIEPALG